jgi:hypothetical protein
MRRQESLAVAVTEALEGRRLLSSGTGPLPASSLVYLWAGHALGLAPTGAAGGHHHRAAAASASTRLPSPVSSSAAAAESAPRSAAQTEADRPTVRELTSPSPRSNVPLDTVVAATVRLPAGGGIDETTVDANTVKLFRGSATGVPVAGQPNTSGGGDVLTFQPADLLQPNTTYTFVITDGVKDTHGNAFVPFSTTFTTGSAVVATDASIAFEKVFLNTAQGERYSTMAFGPDGRLYAGTLTGLIHAFTVNADGTLSAPEVISTVQANNGGRRFLTGITFDPAGTAAAPVLWVTHGQYVTDNGTLNWNAPDWSGKVSRLSGAGLTAYEDYVVGLPRSVRDHLTNQVDFGPDGAMYVGQASNNSMGAPDPIWGMRPERLLSGAILRLDTGAVAARLAAGQGPLNVQTEETATPYDPWAPGAPLTLYATGLRNVFNPVWHRNGQLYAPTNGSAAGGFTPAFAGGTAPRRIDEGVNGPYTGPTVPALSDVQTTEFDYLNKIVAGGYYGHPNPTRGEYVLDGGNPTSGPDADEFIQYPVGTQPDRNYRRSVYTFGRNYAPAGAIEYKGGAFNNALDGSLLVARYSGGDDILVIKLDGAGNVAGVQSGLAGLTHFVDPLDIVQNPTSGFLYVSEDGSKRITLLRPIGPGANVAPDQGMMAFNDVVGGNAGNGRTLTITNSGTAPLAIPSDGLRITGADPAMFVITSRPVLPTTIAPGASAQVTLALQAPAGTAVGSVRTATLEVKSNDADQPLVTVSLRGLVTAGTGGANEPSLQKVLDVWGIPTVVGDADPSTADLYSTAQPIQTPNDEIAATRLVKAGAGPVTMQMLGVFGVSSSPALRFGWYDAGSPTGRQQLFTVANTEAQGVAPPVNGTLSFDPGAKGFGFYSIWPGFSNREVFSEDLLNTQELTPANQHKVRYYRLKDGAGNVVPDALIMAHEEFVNASPNGNYDNQDVVAIVRNVRPAADGPEIGTDNLDAAPYYDRLAFAKIQNNPVGNGMHDTATIRLRNTGTAPLNVTGVSIASGPFAVVSAPGLPGTIPVGGTADVTVQFTATGGRVSPGTLRITSNDADEATLDVALAGYWQIEPENAHEPSLQEVLGVLDVHTVLQNPGQLLTNGGKIEAVGDEVVSPYWMRASPDRPVSVRQLAAFHTSNEGHTVRWFPKGSTASLGTVLTHSVNDAQTLLPRNATNNGPASGSFSPSTSQAFGFKIQNEWSDPTMNTVTGGHATDQGHHVRFFAYKDRTGAVVRDTWLMIMDFAGVNYDYNDNVFVVTNMRPETPGAPAGIVAQVRPEGGFTVAWQPNTDGRTSGYNVYRSLNGSSGFVKLNASPINTPYADATASRGATYFYRVTAVDNWGGESAPSATVQTDLTPPAQVQGLTATSQPESIILSWAANTDPDLVGYRVLRSDLPDGLYTNLSGPTPIVGTTFVDTVSPGGFTWHYRVVAVDASGNQSEPAATSADRPGGPGVVLVTPTDVTAGGATSYGFGAAFSNAVQLSPEALAGAITVTGPGGFGQAATAGATNGRTVSFSITPPGGSWNSADSGTYTISVEGNKLGDGAGNFIPAGVLGTFQVSIAPEYPGATPQNPIDLGTVTAVGRRFKGKFVQRDTLVPGSKTDLFYSFTVTQPAKLKASLAKMKDNLDFELRDASGNVLLTSNKPRRKGEKLVRPLSAGTYLLHVTHVGTAQTLFTMKALVGKPSKKDLALLGGS